MVAGHETSGSTLFHVMVMLAIHPSWQRQMQADLDSMFENRDPATWSYTEDIEKLFRSSVDAVLCESMLILHPPPSPSILD
jgi:cytochrome P450